jgi:hypothetical protein
MTGTFAVLWSLHGPVHSGSLETFADRLELRTRGRSLSVPFASIVRSAIERGPSVRINGLPVLAIALADGAVVRIASLQGAGLLHELGVVIAPAAAVAV